MLIVALLVFVDSMDEGSVDREVLRDPSSRTEPGQHEHMFVWARANPTRSRRPPTRPASVQLVGVDVRRIQRKAGTGARERQAAADDDDVTNTTNPNINDDDMSLVDQLHLARIR